jgi:hypothetical protein
VPFRLILCSPIVQKSPTKIFPLSYNPFVLHNFFIQFVFLNFNPLSCHCVRSLQVLFIGLVFVCVPSLIFLADLGKEAQDFLFF